jgi:hypothetical protein
MVPKRVIRKTLERRGVKSLWERVEPRKMPQVVTLAVVPALKKACTQCFALLVYRVRE